MLYIIEWIVVFVFYATLWFLWMPELIFSWGAFQILRANEDAIGSIWNGFGSCCRWFTQGSCHSWHPCNHHKTAAWWEPKNQKRRHIKEIKHTWKNKTYSFFHAAKFQGPSSLQTPDFQNHWTVWKICSQVSRSLKIQGLEIKELVLRSFSNTVPWDKIPGA